MIRINLLPPEIIERRKYDRFYPYVIVATVVLVAVIVGVWGVMQLLISQQNDVLQQTKEATAQLTAQAESYAIFERKEQELKARELTAQTALAGRVDMGRLAEDISLVLPDEVWTRRVICSQETGVSLDGYTPMGKSTGVKENYKSIAGLLVRLGFVDDLSDIWLNKAQRVQLQASSFQPDTVSADASATVLEYNVTAKINGGASASQGQ